VDRKGLMVMRRNLDAFIRSDPTMITLVRTAKVQTSAGGWVKGTSTPIPAQQMRFVPFKRRMSDAVNNTQDGPLSLAEYILVGRYNVDVQKGDEFDYNGLHHSVTQIEPKTQDRAQTDRVTIALEIRD